MKASPINFERNLQSDLKVCPSLDQGSVLRLVIAKRSKMRMQIDGK